jgi:hypothetical protein
MPNCFSSTFICLQRVLDSRGKFGEKRGKEEKMEKEKGFPSQEGK